METVDMQDRRTQLTIYVMGLLNTLSEEGYVTGGYQLTPKGKDGYDNLRLHGFSPLSKGEMETVFAGIVVGTEREKAGLPLPIGRNSFFDVLEACGVISADGTELVTTKDDLENNPKYKAFSEIVDLLMKVQEREQRLLQVKHGGCESRESAAN